MSLTIDWMTLTAGWGLASGRALPTHCAGPSRLQGWRHALTPLMAGVAASHCKGYLGAGDLWSVLKTTTEGTCCYKLELVPVLE